jgi:hypothetical protein
MAAAQTIFAATIACRPEIAKALDDCMAKTGCTRSQAISMIVLALTEAGTPLHQALDTVLGPGTYQLISDTCWEICQPA